MVDRSVVLDTANKLVQAEEDVVEGLGPIADFWLKEFHKPPDGQIGVTTNVLEIGVPAEILEKENQWRKAHGKRHERDPLHIDKNRRIIWDFAPLLSTISGPQRWNHFVETLERSGRTIQNKQELYLDIKRLINLRDKGHPHRHLGDFTEYALNEFFRAAHRLLRTVGADA